VGRDFYDSPLSRVLGFLVVAIPLALVVGGAIAFRASGIIGQGTPWWVAVLLPAIGFAGSFGFWYLFARGRGTRRSSFLARSKARRAIHQQPVVVADRPPLEQALQAGAVKVGIESPEDGCAGERPAAG
jgi:hypothetical protein